MKRLLFFSLMFLMIGSIKAQQVTMVRNIYFTGEAVSAKFTGSTSTKDWLAIFRRSTVPGSQNNEGWVYTSGTQDASSAVIESGSVVFNSGVTEPGDYKVCLLADDGYTVVSSTNFTVASPVSGLVGEWTFDNPANLIASTIGNPLELHGAETAVVGPTATDGAVRVGVGSYYILAHGMAPNNGSLVNTYSFSFDFKVSDISVWHSFLQTNPNNSDDAELFIGRIGNIGVSTTGYCSQTIRPNTWNRAVVVVDNGSEYSVYLNGVKGLTGYVQPIDGRFSLEPTALLFADNDGEDNEIDVANVKLYNKALTEAEAQSLGGYIQEMRALSSFLTKPYIQNVTPTSATIMWESDFEKPGKVNYGTSDASGNTINASVTPSGANTFIQKVVLTPLQEGTTYYFRAITNSTPNIDQSFKSATTNTDMPFTVGIWGDSHNLNPFAKMASYLVNNLNVDFCVSTGDIATNNGNDRQDLENVFIPVVLGTIGSKVPFYESLGNHDVEGGNLIRNYVKQPYDYNSDSTGISGSYAYVYGNSVFITLDWTRYNTDLAPNGWLETFLKSDASKQAKFRFIFIHCPPFMERWQGAEQEVVKTNIPLLSKKYGVTAVFSGHMHGYERGVLDGVQYITQGGCSYLDVNESVGPTIYPHILVGTNKTGNPANFNNGLTNHLLTLEITPTSATSKLHYFDESGNYSGIIEAVEMTSRTPEDVNNINSTSDFGFSVFPNPTLGKIKINAPENFDINVFNLQGVRVFNKTGVSPSADIDLSKLSSGAYLVKLKAGKNEFARTIIIM